MYRHYEKSNMEKDLFEKYLKECRFNDLDTDITRPDFRFKIGGVDCVPRGEIVAVAGKPGVGKSTAMAIMAGVLVGGCDFGSMQCKIGCQRILWIDTEKGAFSCMQRMKTLREISKIGMSTDLHDSGIDFYRIRNLDTSIRLSFVSEVAKTNKYDAIFIDGIFDLTLDADKDYVPVIDLLKKLTDSGATVFAMLHTNKQAEDDNMRYALGTELQRVCTNRFTIKCDKTKNCHNIIHEKSNDTEIAPIVSFRFNDCGVAVPFIPEISTNAKIDSSKKDFETILSGGVIMGYSELVEKVKDIAKIKERGAKERIAKGMKRGYLVVDDKGNYYLNNGQ